MEELGARIAYPVIIHNKNTSPIQSREGYDVVKS